MITKFSEIKNMAVFQDFHWDCSLKNSANQIQNFKQVNVIYGRNYSGKTTLSRMMRSFETGCLSEKYGQCSFTITTDTGSFTERDYPQKPLLLRVFNDDFVRENLGFVVDPTGSIAPFAVLGEGNEKVETQIRTIEQELGVDLEGARTGLYALKENEEKILVTSEVEWKKASDLLKKQKSEKATDRTRGIKYRPERFGNQNYNISNLENDISIVLADTYTPLTNDQFSLYESHLKEINLPAPKEIRMETFKIADFSATVSELCSRSVGSSNKIQELLRDVALQEWVRQGIEKNKGRKSCAFCGQSLTDNRWKELFSHFDEASESLNQDLLAIDAAIRAEKERIKNAFKPICSEFYSDYQKEITSLAEQYKNECVKCIAALDVLLQLVDQRLKNLHTPIENNFSLPSFSFAQIFENYEAIRKKSIEHANGMSARKTKAQAALRLAEVYNFLKTIDYQNTEAKIGALLAKVNEARNSLEATKVSIKQKIDQITTLRGLQKDETKGAIKVNEYLRTFFGHSSIMLVAKTQEQEDKKQVYFEIEREGKKAFHLSEGEKNLIAFCYFVAKLEDVDTRDKRPIIWIDDPISSLDSNHIYFVYSLITEKILVRDSYEQLFITTHSLLFLKYLRVLSINNHNKNERGRNNFVIERKGKTSELKPMPSYLKKHGTEFNHWFGLIFLCAQQENVRDENLYLFEGFGNNARKFLETYLYYRYPNNESFEEHLEKFFGEHRVPKILVRKVSDEQSHADGDLENHNLPFEELEVKQAAKLILERLETIDKEQYDSLRESIK